LSKKAIGIIGIGNLTNIFFKQLTNSDAGQNILSQTEEFLFYDSRKKSKEELKNSESFKNLEIILSNQIKSNQISLNPTSSLSKFYSNSSVILFLAGIGADNLYLTDDPDNIPASYIFNKVHELQSEGYFRKDNPDDISRVEHCLPINIPLMVEYSKELKPFTEIYVHKPTMVMAGNEPSACSSVMASICPELTDHIIGFSSVDLDRLTELYNKELKELKEQYGLEDVTLKVGIKGNHDHKMIPKLYVDDQIDQEKLKCLFANVNYQGMFNHITKKLINYWHDNHGSGRNLNEQVAVSLVNLTNNILNGLGKSLTPSPEMCNAFLHPLKNEYQGINIRPGRGLFFVGKHKMLNGKLLTVKEKDNVPIDILAEMEFEECKKGHLRLHLELMNENGIKYIEDINQLPFSESSGLKGPFESFSPKIAVAQKNKMRQQIVTMFKDEDYKFTVIEGEPFKFKHSCRSLNTMHLDNGSVSYLLVGHDNDITVQNLEYPEEFREIKIRTGNKKSGCFNNVARLNDKLVASHHALGIFNMKIEDFYDGNLLVDRNKFNKYFMTEHLNGVRASAVIDEDNFFVADNNKVLCYDSQLQLKRSWAFPEIVTSFAYNGNRVFAGTDQGKIFTEDDLLNPMIEFENKSSIANLNANEQFIIFNTFSNCPSRCTYFGNLGSENVEDDLEQIELYASWLGLQDNILYANDRMGKNFVKRNLLNNKEIAKCQMPRLGKSSCIIDY